MKIKGRVLAYGDNIDTDVIIPARYLNIADLSELAKHCMEDADKDFIKKVKAGNIIAGGFNFGCGSSREHAPLVIKESGISAVVAKSFARIFYRNAINIGLPIVEYEGEIEEGDELSIDFKSGVIINETKKTSGNFPPFPVFIEKIIKAGGLLKQIKEEKNGF